MPTPNCDDPIHEELRAMQDCRRDSSTSAREFWQTMYQRARIELRLPWFGRTETEGFVIGQRAHELLAVRGRKPAERPAHWPKLQPASRTT